MEKRISIPQIGDPDNLEKMTAIYMAMREINEIDKSDYFKNYYSEVLGRIITRHANYELNLPYVENQSIEDQERIANNFLKL